MLIDLLFGTAVLTFPAKRCAEILNAAARLDIHFRPPVTDKDITVLKIPLRSASPLLCSVCCADEIKLQTKGLLPFVLRYKKRWGIAAGALIFVFLTALSSNVIWSVDVTGNKNISDKYITDILANLGCRPGAFYSSIDFDTLHNRFLMESEGIGWISVNMNGTRANVEVRETSVGEREADSTYYNLIAAEDGQIERIAAIEGKPQVKISQTVEKGQLLVSGILSREEGGIRLESASGSVYAKVTRNFSVSVPLKTEKKVYTGEKTEKKSVTFFSFNINLFTNSRIPYDFYDTIETEKRLYLFDTAALPVLVGTKEYREYENAFVTLTEDEAKDEAMRLYREKLKETLGTAQLLSKSTDISIENEVCTVSCSIYCLADIAKPAPFDIAQDSDDEAKETENAQQ